MGIADSMKGITENIIGSYDVRVKALKDLVSDTRKTIKGFADDRKEMSEKQAKNLADFVNDLTKNIGAMLKGFKASHKEMSEEQAKNLAAFVKSIAKDVAAQLKGFHADREKMSEELKEKLTKEIHDIKTHVKKLLGDADKLVSEYRSDIGKARAAWQGMAGSLAKSRKGGVMTRIEAGEKVTTVEESIEKKGKKTAGKKRGRKKNR